MKQRLDQLLVELGFFDSREKARTAIMSNCVKIAGQVQNKVGTQINLKTFEAKCLENPNHLEVQDNSCPYVGRGAYKLEGAQKEWGIDFKNKIVLDMGASTGGFTDFALQNAASRVLAVDVGKGQLDYKLRNNGRVHNLEGINMRYLKFEQLQLEATEMINIAVSDLSFISITKVLDNLKALLAQVWQQYTDHSAIDDNLTVLSESAIVQCIFLIKPQFEAGKEIIDKCQGVIKDDFVRQQILDTTVQKIQMYGFELIGIKESPIKGAKGNIEFLAYFQINSKSL